MPKPNEFFKFCGMRRVDAKADTAWRKSRIAARLLMRKEARPLRPREQALATQSSNDPK